MDHLAIVAVEDLATCQDSSAKYSNKIMMMNAQEIFVEEFLIKILIVFLWLCFFYFTLKRKIQRSRGNLVTMVTNL